MVQLLSLVGEGRFEIAVSVALVLEYEDALLRHLAHSPFDEDDLGELLDFLCKIAHRQEIFYLWRPVLHDPADDMILEIAVASRARFIVTFNERHFAGCEAFGIRVVTPRTFLEEIGDIL
jgi:predicted nucleic acid-binding protein